MSPTNNVSVALARQIVTAEKDPYAPSRLQIVDHEAHLLHDNPDAELAEIYEALEVWIAEQTEERRAESERRAAELEQQRQRTSCRRCGQRPGETRVLLGPPGLREQIWNSAHGVTVRLCPSCFDGVSYALGRLAYEADSTSFDEFAQRVLTGDPRGLC